VLHVALRAPRDAVINSDGVNVVPEVWAVIDKIKQFSETFRSGSWVIIYLKKNLNYKKILAQTVNIDHSCLLNCRLGQQGNH
jgi:hypothetical protein